MTTPSISQLRTVDLQDNHDVMIYMIMDKGLGGYFVLKYPQSIKWVSKITRWGRKWIDRVDCSLLIQSLLMSWVTNDLLGMLLLLSMLLLDKVLSLGGFWVAAPGFVAAGLLSALDAGVYATALRSSPI